MPKKGKKLDESKIQQHMEAYSDATVGSLLDSAFNPTDSTKSGHQAERGDHIIIDGRTARELLVEEFSKTHDPSDSSFKLNFQRYYSKEGKNLINQRVAAALMTGKRVEVFVPDPKTGRIGKEPSRITKTGYEPSDLKKPAQMNRWQKFWSKLGFYKDKVAEQESYKRQMAARDRVQFYNKATRINSVTLSSQIPAITEAWGEKYPERKGVDLQSLKRSDGYRLDRQGLPCYVNAVLARERDENGKFRYTNEQLFDMSDPMMNKARADAAEDIYQHDLKGDTDWLLTLQHDSRTALTERINEQGKNLDFSKPDVTEQKGYREYLQLNNTAFEISQEIDELKKELNEKYGPTEHKQISSTLGELPNVVKLINASLDSQRELMSGMVGTGTRYVRIAMGEMIGGQIAQQHLAAMQKDPKIPPSEYVKGTTMETITSARRDATLEDDDVVGEPPLLTQQSAALEREFVAAPEKIAAQIASGVFGQRIKLQEPAPAPVRIEVRDAATVEREMKQQPAKQTPEAGPTL